MKVKELYKKAYELYSKSLRRFARRYGVEVEKIGRVKKPTAGSLRRLAKERERVRSFYKGMTPKREPGDIPDIDPDPEEVKARVALQEIEDMIEEARSFVWTGTGGRDSNPGGEAMVHASAMAISELFEEAKKKYTATEILHKIEEKYGDINIMLDMLYKLLYAVFGSGNSGFAKWAGKDARARWNAEMRRLEEAFI